MTKTDFKNIYEAFMHCDTNKLKKEFAAMYSDNEEQATAVKEVDRAFARMETVTPKAVNPDEQSIIVVCKGFGDEGDDTVCIEVEDLRKWREEHLKESEPISDEMLTFMSTDEIENAVMNQDLPTKYAFELSAWDEILSWKLAPSSIYIYGLEFCLSRVLWEMTFFGVDESGVELEKEKLDTRFEEAQRFFDENKEPQIGFSIEDISYMCGNCNQTTNFISKPEQYAVRIAMGFARENGVPNAFDEVRHIFGYNNKYGVDFVDNTRKVCMEYNGVYWHKDKKRVDCYKFIKIHNAGYTFIRILEPGLKAFDKKYDIVLPKNYKHGNEYESKIMEDLGYKLISLFEEIYNYKATPEIQKLVDFKEFEKWYDIHRKRISAKATDNAAKKAA